MPAPQDPMRPEILTDMRTALWVCFEAYQPLNLKGYFRAQFRGDVRSAKNQTGDPVQEISPKDVPAIAIRPAVGSNPWTLNSNQDLTYTLTVITVHPQGALAAAERTIVNLIRASFMKIDGVDHIEEMFGHPPTWNSFTIGPGESKIVENFRVLQAIGSVTLRTDFDPIPNR